MDDGADRACIPCRKNKRRCDKQLPTCGTCRRVGRDCDYSVENEPNDLQRRVQQLERTVSQLSGRIPASSASVAETPADPLYPTLSTQAYFLDPDVWSSIKNFHSAASSGVAPDEVIARLGSQGDIDAIKNGYFQTIHSWMPFISKIKLERATQDLNTRFGADTALLLLCMKLVQKVPARQMPQPLDLYASAKKFHDDLNSEGVLTLRVLQAGTLLLIYELGQGLFPAAFMMISHCARLGVALGLHNKDAPQLLSRPRAWVDWEERQRVWWAIVILDRYIALGGSYRPLCCEDPGRDTLLPVDEHAWNNGEMMPPDRVSLSSSTTNVLGSFARLSQASNLLGRVIRHCNDSAPNMDVNFVLDNFDALHQAISSLLELLPTPTPNHNQPLDGIAERAICYSALFILGEHHSCNIFEEDGEVLDEAVAPRARESSKKAFEIIKDTCRNVTLLAQESREILLENDTLDVVSPLVLGCLYHAAQNIIWMALETNNPELEQWKWVCEDVLGVLSERWGVAGIYLELLKVSKARDDE
ncbi:hypothetical protein BDW74DRAFT_172828 [Aspergillus multicolor]|uniref:uncharacterized protein n=1 Tax=Aspergillus multicolor TaxID=41759 RepID=UPI003CCE4A6C